MLSDLEVVGGCASASLLWLKKLLASQAAPVLTNCRRE
jgi:hypothetical protein